MYPGAMIRNCVSIATALLLRTCLCVDVSQSVGVDVTGPRSSNSDDVDREAEVRSLVEPGLWPVYVLYRGFLDVVQPEYLHELDETLQLQSFDDFVDSLQCDWDEWLLYFIGFSICVGVGLVTFVAMLFSSFCVPCCRCCGNCGGRQSPKDGRNADCTRTCYSLTLVIIDCILLLGAVCMVVTGEKLKQQLEGNDTVFDNTASGLSRLEPYLASTVDEVNDSVWQQYVAGSNEIFSQLYDLPKDVLEAIDANTSVLEANDTLSAFSDQLQDINSTLLGVTKSSLYLQDEVALLNSNVTQVKNSVINELTKCQNDSFCQALINLTELLRVDVDYSIVNVSTATDAIQVTITSDFSALVRIASDELQKISTTVENATKPVIGEAEKAADLVENDVEVFVKELAKKADNFIDGLSEIRESIRTYEETVEGLEIADYVYWSTVGIAVLICCVVLTSVLGVLYCCCRRTKNTDPCCSCTRRQGSHWLLVGNCLTLVTYWLLILVVIVMFSAGGLVYTEACRNLIYYSDPDSRQVLDVFDRLITNSTDVPIGVFEAYITCVNNESVYTAFKLAEQGHNLSEYLNLTALEQKLEEIKAHPITIPNVQLTNSTLAGILDTLQQGAALDYESMKTELRKNVTTVDMKWLASLLNMTTGSFNVSLANDTQSLRELADHEDNITLIAQQTAIELDWVTSIMPSDFNSLHQTLNHTQVLLNNHGTLLAAGAINRTVDDVIDELNGLANRVIESVEQDVGRCRPVYDTVTYVVDSVCILALYPMNCFWFSLGWCLFFLIPHLILSFKLVNLFRKTEPYKSGKQSGRHKNKTPPVSGGEDNFAYELTEALEAYRKEIASNPQHPGYGILPRPSVKMNTNSWSTTSTSISPPPYEYSKHYKMSAGY